jgi:hypothetical protein
MDRGKFGSVWPRARAFDSDAQTFQDFGKSIQILFRLFNNPLRKRAARNFGQRTVRKFRELGASVWRRIPRTQRIAYNNFFQLIPLIATPYT